LQEPKLASGDEWRRLLAAKDVDTQVLIDARREGVKHQDDQPISKMYSKHEHNMDID